MRQLKGNLIHLKSTGEEQINSRGTQDIPSKLATLKTSIEELKTNKAKSRQLYTPQGYPDN